MTLLRFVSVLLAGLGAAVAMGCAHETVHVVESPCAGIDWWEVGRTDGVSGEPLEKSLRESQVRCPNVDVDLFKNGHEAGLVEYCSPAQGLAAGRSGLAYENSCPPHLERAFLEKYQEGRRIQRMELEHSSITPLNSATRAL